MIVNNELKNSNQRWKPIHKIINMKLDEDKYFKYFICLPEKELLIFNTNIITSNFQCSTSRDGITFTLSPEETLNIYV